MIKQWRAQDDDQMKEIIENDEDLLFSCPCCMKNFPSIAAIDAHCETNSHSRKMRDMKLSTLDCRFCLPPPADLSLPPAIVHESSSSFRPLKLALATRLLEEARGFIEEV